MSVLPRVLALGAAILGLFILYSLIVPRHKPSQYNIACYLLPHPLNHTAQLHARILKAQNEMAPMTYQTQSLVADPATFEKQMVTLTSSFEKYAQQIAKQQELRLQDRQIMMAIQEAEQNYFDCRAEVQTTINGSECFSIWDQYQQCFESVKSTQSHIDNLLTIDRQTQDFIHIEIRQPQTNPEDSPEAQAERIYNTSMGKNDVQLESKRQRLQQAEFKLSSTRELKDKAEDRFQTKQHTYSECFNNRRIYRQCEQISEQVKNLNTGTLKQLQQQLQAKGRLMQEMRDMIVRMGKGQGRKLPQHWSDMYQSHINEYKQMHKEFIHYNSQMQKKACGCSQQEQVMFLKDVNGETRIIEEYEKELVEMERIIERLKKQVQEKEQERDRIIWEYQKALKEYATTPPELRESRIIKLKNTLVNNRKKILDQEHTFNDIEARCNIIKQRLARTVRSIDKVEQCLSKQYYLQKLRAATQPYIQPQRSPARLLQSKRHLLDALKALEP